MGLIFKKYNDIPFHTNNYIKQKWSIKTQFIKLDKKQNPIMYCLQENHYKCEDLAILKLNGWETTYHANSKQKKVGMIIFNIKQSILQNK